jgi:hypothetical protein
MTLRLVIFYVLIACSELSGQDFGLVKNGELDLREWNQEEHPVISLDGDWEFYWNSLLLSKDLPKQENKSFALLSLPWNEQFIGGQQLPENGYASYALKILLPKNMTSVSFAVPAVFNCYAFWVNDQLICASGKVGKSVEEMIPQWRPQTVTIPSPGDTLQVIFQISNFQDTRGGCAEVMRIGNTEYLTGVSSAFHTSGIALILFFGIVSVAGLIIFFIFRPISFLFLSLLAMAFTIRFIFSDLYFYYDFGLNIPWEMAAKIEYVTIPLIVICGALFISSIYPKEFKRTRLYFFIVANAVLAAVVTFSPSSIFSPLVLMMQVVALTFTLFVIYVLVKALIFQRAGAWISVLGLTVFALVGFYNVYAFINVADLNRIVIHIGYGLALLLNVTSLVYRTPMRIHAEESDTLHFHDFFKEQSVKEVNR